MTGSPSAKPPLSDGATDPTISAAQAAQAEWRTTLERESSERSQKNATRRIEPSMEGGEGFPPAPSTAYERLHGIPDFGECQPPRRSRVWRLIMMISVFIIGATVGLAVTWWLHRPKPKLPAASIDSNQPASMPPSTSQRPATMRGISPNELPYDGAIPPDAAEDAIARGDATGRQGDKALYSDTGAASSASASAVMPRSAMPAGSASFKGDATKEAPATTAVAEPGKNGKQPKAAKSDDDVKPAASPRQSGTSAAKSPPTRRSASRSATDREIERIRQQADEELKKKTEYGRRLENTPGAAYREGRRQPVATTSASRPAVIRAMVARCDRTSNLIRREVCKWRLCNGSWGKNGCPSYQERPPSY